MTLVEDAPAPPGAPEPPPPQPREKRERASWFVRITILTVVLLWLIPAVGVLVTSFRPEALVDTSGWWTALGHPFRGGEWTLENYRVALDAGGFQNAFLNSLAVTIPTTVMPITIAAFAAYAFSWMEFRGRYVLFVLVVGLLVVPLQMALIPILRLYTSGASIGDVQIIPDLDLNGTFLGVWLAHTAFGLPLATYLLRNYIGSLPSSIIESAKIDGADHFTIFTRLVVPLSVPALAAFAIFQFLWVWNDLLIAYIFLGGTSENRVITIALANLVGARGENWHLLTSAAFISMLLPLAVFFAMQRYFVRGLTARIGQGLMAATSTSGVLPLPPMKKWRAITIATLVLVPAFWSLLIGLVAVATDETPETSAPGAAIAFGLALIPFVFIALAFLSENPRAPGAVAKAMGLCLLVGIPVSALAGDAVTGLVAGVGAGGIVALRTDPGERWQPRALGVLTASAYVFVLARVAGSAVLFPAPVFALTCLGLADHLVEWRGRR